MIDFSDSHLNFPNTTKAFRNESSLGLLHLLSTCKMSVLFARLAHTLFADVLWVAVLTATKSPQHYGGFSR